SGAAIAGLSAQSFLAAEENANETIAESIKAFCIDFNWDKPHLAKPGRWADADPKEHIKWYKELGCNIVQTFCVSCNGYAWYKGGVVPEQPDLKHDFLTDMVNLGHKEKMKVFGYYCVGANSRWQKEHPEENYAQRDLHVPLTNKYLDYLGSAIEDAVKKTGIDGFMIDWLWNPPKDGWLKCEQEMYVELMNEKFPGVDKVSKESTLEYRRRSIDRCWKRIYETAKSVSPNILIWLSCSKPDHNEIAGSSLFQQVDWFMNEAGDIERLKKTIPIVGKQTRLLTCLAAWNRQDPKNIINKITESKLDIGLYGFTMPTQNTLPPPIQTYLTKPIDTFKGDEKNIAVFARIYNKLPLDYVQK
ncbi:MAG: family 10 glycosylhydrolase, partial [Planctomycetaceae bacterium]|nr:family 10 glycosylhydrolase [Planctomycetaceae bacterium]